MFLCDVNREPKDGDRVYGQEVPPGA
jgi:hypothetical protein